MRRAQILLALILAGTAAACGQELLAGGETATVQGQATDGTAAGSSPQVGPTGDPARLALAPALGVQAPGTVRFTASMELLDGAGAAVPLSGGPVNSILPLDAGEVVSLGTRQVAVGTYPRVRVTFTSVEVQLVGAVGTAATVRVDLAEPLVVEVPLGLDVAAGETRAVRVNLNTAAWLADAVDGVVPASALEAAVGITTFAG